MNKDSDAPRQDSAADTLCADTLYQRVGAVYKTHGEKAALELINAAYALVTINKDTKLHQAANKALRAVESASKGPASNRAKAAAMKEAVDECDWLTQLKGREWGDSYRGSPNDLTRLGFISGRRKGPRFWVKNQPIAYHKEGQSLRSYMTYTGQELRVMDYAVLVFLYHLHRSSGTAEAIKTPAAAIIIGAGWAATTSEIGGNLYAKLERTLVRLYEVSFTIHEPNRLGVLAPPPRKVVFSNRPSALTEDLDTSNRMRFRRLLGMLDINTDGSYTTKIGDSAAPIWAAAGFSVWPAEERNALKSTLAIWLHAYYATHRMPYAIKITTFQELMHVKELRRRDMERALTSLVEIGFLSNYSISQSGLVTVIRTQKDLDSPGRDR